MFGVSLYEFMYKSTVTKVDLNNKKYYTKQRKTEKEIEPEKGKL